MTPSQLKAELMELRPESPFFSRENMRFAGDTMANYGVRLAIVGDCPCYELFRRRPVRYGLKKSAYFRCSDMRQVWP